MSSKPKLPGLVSSPLISDWIQVETNGSLTIRTGRSELGQGIHTAFVDIAAHELDFPTEKIKILPPDTAVSPNEGFTAGSLSIQQGGETIRLATSALRQLCVMEATARFNCDAKQIKVEKGFVKKKGGRKLRLTELAASIDLNQPILDYANPKPILEKYSTVLRIPRFLGIPRQDLRERMIGHPFIHDITFEDMLVGKVIHPPTPNAKLKNPFDKQKLLARDGVEHVVVDGEFIGFIAESNATAEAAYSWIQPQLFWEIDEIPETDPFKLMDNSNAEPKFVSSEGFKAPNRTAEISCESRRGFLNHGSIGPSTAVAKWTKDGLTVWCATQGVFPLRSALSQVFSEDETRIRVIYVPGAGCYGHNGADDAALDAALLARCVIGQPVRVMWSRSDEFTVAPKGAAFKTKVNIWTEVNGDIEAMTVQISSPPHSMRPTSSGAPCLYSAQHLQNSFPMPAVQDVPIERGGGAIRNGIPIYADDNFEIDCKLVNGLPWRTSSLRSLGAHLNVYAIETAVETAAIAANQDSFEYRMNHVPDQRSYDVLNLLNIMYRGVPEAKAQNWGLGFARYKGMGAWAAVLARVELDVILRVTDVLVAVDIGEIINEDGVCNQIEGGVLQSISWTLKEQVNFAGASVSTQSWEDYPILKFSEIPNVEIDMIESSDSPLGCAEIVQGPTAAAIGNAVLRLTGCHMESLPLTRESIISNLSK